MRRGERLAFALFDVAAKQRPEDDRWLQNRADDLECGVGERAVRIDQRLDLEHLPADGRCGPAGDGVSASAGEGGEEQKHHSVQRFRHQRLRWCVCVGQLEGVWPAGGADAFMDCSRGKARLTGARAGRLPGRTTT